MAGLRIPYRDRARSAVNINEGAFQDKIWGGWGEGGSVGFCERDALIMVLLKRKTEFLYLMSIHPHFHSL